MKKEVVFKAVLVAVIFFLTYQFGIRPTLNGEFLKDVRRSSEWAGDKLTKEDGKYDVIVFGEEPEGIVAAFTAAKAGAKTLLISEGEDLGGIASKSLCNDMEIGRDEKGDVLNKGLTNEFYRKIGETYPVEKYKSSMDRLVKGNENLDVIYGAKLEAPVLDSDKITGIEVSKQGEKKSYSGKRFIDATLDGKLLAACGVPYFTGSGDISLSNKFMPAAFNFEISDINWSKIDNLVSSPSSELYSKIAKYKPINANMKINNFKIIYQGDGKAVVHGLEVAGLNLNDEKAVKAAYEDAKNEAISISVFLNTISEFKGCKFSKGAEQFYLREFRHFKGEYTLSVNDILENKDFDDKIAIASYPVDGSKLSDNNEKYIIGVPVKYAIRLGCIVPLKVENLLMVGNKISYSSLAASSASRISTNIAVGEASAVAAVYSLTENITPREMVSRNDESMTAELRQLYKTQGMSLENFSIENGNTENWSYASVRKLNALGLIASGTKNNFQFEKEAVQGDLAYLLLNGIYRAAPDKYSIFLNGRLKLYFTRDKLTREKAGEILLALNGAANGDGNAYGKACASGYINDLMQLRLKDKKVLTMDDVYNLAYFNIRLFTGKDVED